MKLKHLVLLSSALILSQPTSAAGKNKGDRWFEMEVILFSQLGDKALLKEQFPEHTDLPNYNHVIDLLGPYLSPDISDLKQKLPHCDKPEYPVSLVEKAVSTITEQPLYIEKSLSELAQLVENESAESHSSTTDRASYFSDGTATFDSSLTDGNIADESIADESIENSLAIENLAQQQNSAADLTIQTQASELESVLSPRELAQRTQLLAQAQEEFSPTPLSYSNVSASFDKGLCTISVEQFNQYNQQGLFDNYSAFNIDKVPATINNHEDIYTNNDYLLDAESLKLHDIVKQLTRSKNFKPLMHFGWRQKTKTKRLAVPLKILAGENYAYHYQQALQQYQQQLEQAQTQEEMLNKALFEQSMQGEEISPQALKQQAINQRLQQLIVKVPNLPTDTENLFNEIERDESTTQELLSSKSVLAAPIKPPQDWTIEGFLKVEVDFYLHITADFNIMNMSLAQLATQQLLPSNKGVDSKESTSAQLTTVNFKQDRRVRSKEIHYFDHPYMGMIIRILPYKKPIKTVELPDSTN